MEVTKEGKNADLQDKSARRLRINNFVPIAPAPRTPRSLERQRRIEEKHNSSCRNHIHRSKSPATRRHDDWKIAAFRPDLPARSANVDHFLTRTIVGKASPPPVVPFTGSFGRPHEFNYIVQKKGEDIQPESYKRSVSWTWEDRESQPLPCRVEVLISEFVVDVACGRSHSIVLNEDHEVFTFGLGLHGQLGRDVPSSAMGVPRPVKELSGIRITSVSAGALHSFAISDTGIVFGWGQNTFGQLGFPGHPVQPVPVQIPIPPGELICSAAGGEKHSLFLARSGQIFSCGNNAFGQLGTGPAFKSFQQHFIQTVELPKGDACCMSIACGSWHSAAVTDEGKVYCWGLGKNGQLGTGGTADQSSPTAVQRLNGVRIIQVACGSSHTLAVAGSGRVYSWGCGQYGALGHGSELNLLVPRLVQKLAQNYIKHVSCGSTQSIAITAYGQALVWGGNAVGELGLGDTRFMLEPEHMHDMRDKRILKIASQSSHCLGITVTGALYAWGNAQHGQLGLVDNGCPPDIPKQLKIKQRFVSIACGHSFTLAVTDFGSVYTWGSGKHGCLGIGHTEDRPKPQRLAALQGQSIYCVVAGPYQAAALSRTGDAHVWGCGAYGALGLGATGDCLLPRPLPSMPCGRPIASFSFGHAHAAAITTDDKLWFWGRLDVGVAQLEPFEVPVPIGPAIEVQCGASTLAVLSTGGRVCTWTSPSTFHLEELDQKDQRSREPSSTQKLLKDVKSPRPLQPHVVLDKVPGLDELHIRRLACGPRVFVAVGAGGEVVTWGTATNGQLGQGDDRDLLEVAKQVQGPPQKVALDVASGPFVSMAITDIGALYVWGSGLYGAHGLGDTLMRTRAERVTALPGVAVVRASCGAGHSAVISDHGTLHLWGNGSNGQLGLGSFRNELLPRQLTLEPGSFVPKNRFGMPDVEPASQTKL